MSSSDYVCVRRRAMKGAGRVLQVIAELSCSFIITGQHETMSASEKEPKIA